MTTLIPESKKKGGFFQFPLFLLAQPLSFRELLMRSFHYGVCHYLDIREENEDEPPDWGIPWRGSAAARKTAFDQAHHKIGFSGGDVNAMIQNHAIVAQIEDARRQQGRKTATIRLRTNIHLDTLNESALSERDWRVLCAVFSAIGDKPFVEIGWQRIAWRAAGWLSPVNSQTKPCGPLYPRGQIERSLSKLVAREFVRVFTYRRGERFWSHRCTHDQLLADVAAMKTKRAKAAAERKRLDQQQSQLIHASLHPDAPAPRPRMSQLAAQTAARPVLWFHPQENKALAGN
jgi:hypothetical protein